MTRFLRSWLLCFSSLLLCSSAFGQKIKYKDIFPELEAQEYAAVQSELETFLEVNPDHASANLQMGFLAESYLEDCEQSVYYFERALDLIDEKEVKKNEDYYLQYQRRDLRTGKIGVKLPDIQLDIEQRIAKCS